VINSSNNVYATVESCSVIPELLVMFAAVFVWKSATFLFWQSLCHFSSNFTVCEELIHKVARDILLECNRAYMPILRLVVDHHLSSYWLGNVAYWCNRLACCSELCLLAERLCECRAWHTTRMRWWFYTAWFIKCRTLVTNNFFNDVRWCSQSHYWK